MFSIVRVLVLTISSNASLNVVNSLSPAGMLYPAAAPDVQSYLFRKICQPTLCYGTECMNISHRDVDQLDSTQR